MLKKQKVVEVQFPITASKLKIDYLIVGPSVGKLTYLAATISDWKIPPVALFILTEDHYQTEHEKLLHHPRVGRSIFLCKDTEHHIAAGLAEVYSFYEKRESLPLDHSVSGTYNTNNISPRWLFQTMMEHLDEYIYFKDADSRFLAVSRYFAESCGKEKPADVLGLTDFELFDQTHAGEAFSDERKIATGELQELSKEEAVIKDGKTVWVASRKLPLRTRSNYLAGSFGLSRDVTDEKMLHQKLEENHERMHAELKLARNLQSTLMQKEMPVFTNKNGDAALEIATKYIPSFHLSGDFFSINQTACGGAAILIADVMGHGVRAAMVTAMIEIAVQQLQSYASQPAIFMSRLNEIMKRTMQTAGQTIFATAAYCYINLDDQELTYSQAGAKHGIYVPKDTEKRASVLNNKSVNPALGLIPDIEYTEERMHIAKGDEIILYTDGIIEAALGDEEYSEARMLDLLTNHRRDTLPTMLDALLESVHQFTHSDDLDDDVCLIGLRLS
ncbi:MAG: SpoIIE family protein phosphatase [Opitutaceae bacterium]